MINDSSQDTRIIKQNQSGQTLLEFMLLLLSIAMISFTFMRLINTNISDRWEKLANLLLDDPTQTIIIP